MVQVITHNRARLVIQHLLDFLQNLWGQFGQNVDGTQVLDHLLGLRGSENHGTRVRVHLSDPRQGELSHAAL